jgi:serine/threonine protein phosphatase PrpC
MTLALRYAVRSDVGLLREGNEDSAYAGPHLLAVADGMGGHAAGEVASAATISAIAPLDAEHLGQDLVDALADAVASANMRLKQLIISDPSVEGMGTTLTALLWSDGHAALCHIGDSRAYLLRNGHFYQITHDHTLVQSLVDEGKITEDDVATHPHRSLLLRALDGRTVAEPDLFSHETIAGDRYLLCSDGLTGVVTEQTLHQTLSSVWDPEKAALQLVELAIRGGGPDNITCIVADVVDTQTTALPPTRVPVLAGAASHGSGTEPRAPARQNSPATRAMRLARTTPQQAVPDEEDQRGWSNGYGGSQQATGDAGTGGRRGHRARRPAADDDEDDDYPGPEQREVRRRWPIVTTLLVVLVLLVGGGLYGGYRYVQGQYFIGVQDNNVAIFRGVNQNLLGISLSSPVQRTSLPIGQVVPSNQGMIRQTIAAGSLHDAQNLVGQIQSAVSDCRQKYEDLATWQSHETSYLRAVAAYNALPAKKKPKNPPSGNPGPEPAVPDSGDCAPSTAFGIPASALPTGQPATQPTIAPATKPSATPSARVTPRTSPTPRKSA